MDENRKSSPLSGSAQEQEHTQKEAQRPSQKKQCAIFWTWLYAPLYAILRTPLHALDAWLWRRGFHIPPIRAMALGQIVCALLLFAVAAVFSLWTLWLLWFAVGMCIFTYVFWGISGHLSRVSLTAYSTGLLFGLLIRMALHMGIIAIVLYMALVICSASAFALVCGVTANMAVALGVFARYTFCGSGGYNQSR